ncbi:MAG: N-acetylmuramoyl-L-alanine amidase [Bacteroidaceae bacterium]|nr:N-acetylmuramoyl-L-alanine amidase [Bacteroidaceae bacterium]
MAKIKRIVVHCTAEPSNAKRNREYYHHYFFEVKKWKHYGYHAIVFQDGTWCVLQKWPEVKKDGGYITNDTTANGAAGFNTDSMHIAYVGGLLPHSTVARDTRTQEQKKTLWAIIACWKRDYQVTEVVGHNQLPGVKKACPCFDAKTVYRNA